MLLAVSYHKTHCCCLQMDALDQYVFGPECHPAFDMAVRMENYTGQAKLARASSSSGVVSAW